MAASRKIAFLIFVTIVTALLSSTGLAESARAALDPAEVLGKWHYQQKRLGASVDSVSTYETKNRYHAKLKIKILSATSSVNIEGTWEVAGDSIKITITKSNSALFFPVGKVLLKKAVEIDGKEMRYLYDGKEETERRLDDQ